MSLVLFTKSLSDHGVAQLIERGHGLGVDGYDLCVRAGHPVEPATAAATLVAAVRDLQAAGLAVPMVTGPFDLLRPDHPAAQPIMAAMDAADVRLLKLGYFAFDPVRIGAYLDPCHLLIEGEEFATGAAIVADHLAIIGLKDALLVRERRAAGAAQGAPLSHGAPAVKWVEAGAGMVDWSAVRAALRRLAFAGPLSIHCEYEDPPGGHLAAMQREVTFFRSLFDAHATG